MTKRTTASADDTLPKLDMQRVRVNRDGYDSSGAYWGAGPDVFIVSKTRLRHDATTADGADEITVRARNVADAREKVAAELARQPGAAKVSDMPIGGAAPRKTTYEIEWRNPVTGIAVRIRIVHARDYLSTGNDHLEIESIKPKKAPLPISETGFRSHFMPALELVNAGGPVTFVTAWIEREAAGTAWQKQAAVNAQGDLFQWADAQTEIATRKKPASKPSPPSAKPRRKHAHGRSPA